MWQTSSVTLLILVLLTATMFAGAIQVNDSHCSRKMMITTNLKSTHLQVEAGIIETRLSLFVLYIDVQGSLYFIANLTDINGNPVAGEIIFFSLRRYSGELTEGWIPLGTATTNAAGTAVFSLAFGLWKISYSTRARHEQHLNFSACEKIVDVVIPSGQFLRIKSDGSIDPPTAPIQKNGDSYFLTDDIIADSAGIAIERDNITLDGMGHLIQPHPHVIGKYGIDLNSRTNVTIQNVRIRSFAFGIELLSSTGNTITRNSYIGSEYPTLLQFAVFEDGIRLRHSTNNDISRNEVVNCHAGLYIESSSSNKIYHNNFASMRYKPVEISYDSVNTWSDDYPSGGNFWSDYTGADLFRGPFQNMTGSDGIGDTPYVIDQNNQDRYPLMYKWPDKTSPETFDNYDGLWHSADFTITLTATDDESKSNATYYKINDGPTKTVDVDGQPHITTEGANNELEYWSVDNAGNAESHHILTGIKLDKTAPRANAGEDKSVGEGILIIFNGSASDENGIASYVWTFIDNTQQTLNVQNPIYDFKNAGIHVITLKVTDPAGNYATDTVTITVLDLTKPTANAGPDQTINVGTTVTLDGSASHDNVDVASYTWYFTDCVPRILIGIKPKYTFNTPGIYAITLNVTDNAENWATDTTVITVLSITKPTANAGQDQTVNVGTMVRFDAGGSANNISIVSYDWNFGDGIAAIGKTASHGYTAAGTYNVTLTVKDSAGNSASDYLIVTVLSKEVPSSSPEAIPVWIVGAVITIIGIAVGATLLLRRRK